MSIEFIFADGVDKEKALASPMLAEWRKRMNPDWIIDRCEIASIDIWPTGRVGFIELDVQYSIANYTHSERVILSGGSVTIVCLIHCTTDDKLYTVMVQQPRIASGKLMYEYPAGLADDCTDHRDVAVRELEEECKIIASKEELIDLNAKLIGSGYFNTNEERFDEYCSVFLVRRNMTIDEINDLQGRECGVDEEEQITVKVIPFDDVWNTSSDCATLGITYEIQSLMESGAI